MLELSVPQATLASAAIGIAGVLAGWLGRGAAFVLRRWWTGASRQEETSYLTSVADLAVKLGANGLTLDDVRKFEAILRNPGTGRSDPVIGKAESMEPEPSEFSSNPAMKARAEAACRVAEAQLEQDLTSLRLLMSDREQDSLADVQARWLDYRTSLENLALRQFEGGTHAPLAMMLANLSETERRGIEIRQHVAERLRTSDG